MKIYQSKLSDPEYAAHLKGECDLDCKFCREEEEEEARESHKKDSRDES